MKVLHHKSSSPVRSLNITPHLITQSSLQFALSMILFHLFKFINNINIINIWPRKLVMIEMCYKVFIDYDLVSEWVKERLTEKICCQTHKKYIFWKLCRMGRWSGWQSGEGESQLVLVVGLGHPKAGHFSSSNFQSMITINILWQILTWYNFEMFRINLKIWIESFQKKN